MKDLGKARKLVKPAGLVTHNWLHPESTRPNRPEGRPVGHPQNSQKSIERRNQK